MYKVLVKVKNKQYIKRLCIPHNNITDVQSIGEGLSKQYINDIVLFNNNITDDSGIQSIIDGLKTNNTLKELPLGLNQRVII